MKKFKLIVGLLCLGIGIYGWLHNINGILTKVNYFFIDKELPVKYRSYLGEQIFFSGILLLGIYITDFEIKRPLFIRKGKEYFINFSNSLWPILGRFLLIFGIVLLFVGFGFQIYLHKKEIYGTFDIDMKVISILNMIIGAYLLRLSSFEKK